MSRDKSRKIYLSKNGEKRHFVSYYMQDSDGSFYLTLQREGENDESLIFDNAGKSPEKSEFESPRSKSKKITYHSSGCVRYHNTDHGSKYFEPISKISQLNCFATWSIPSIEKLDHFKGNESEEDFVSECDDIDGRISFTFCIARWNTIIDIPHIAIRYNKLFSLIIIIHILNIELPDEVEDHFITIAPKKGIYDEQPISSEQALIWYHQMVQETDKLIIYSPNGEGKYKAICTVPMIIPPKLEIIFENSKLQAEVAKSSVACVRFKVLDSSRNTIKNEVPILSIALNAEL